ncbi:MAG: D-alanine--D-alanine ligase [Rhodospirillaceae bacterium]|nr:D-alanine--D-alanine ligase [Rhodospirillaceae bacterium]|tara:strand:+ start:1408 stop:2316 length:909 start_codon:yes stop_codon:yes gene_type:complete
MTQHVAVLMGGWSSEREVSLSSGSACSSALRKLGYRVSEVDVDRNIPKILSKLKPDVCFNALHGPMGEDGNIQGLLNIMGIPYTHSGVQASAIAMDKVRTKELCGKAGLCCPDGSVVSRKEFSLLGQQTKPFVVKPVAQGSSIGVHIIKQGHNYNQFLEDWSYGEKIIVEKFIPGRELTVGVFDGTAFCVTEITSKRGFYDYEAKYEDGGSVHILPADIPRPITNEALCAAVCAHQTLGCRGLTRSDFRYDDTESMNGGLYFLEINTQPGMTSNSLVPEQAAHVGITFTRLVAEMVEAARCD